LLEIDQFIQAHQQALDTPPHHNTDIQFQVLIRRDALASSMIRPYRQALLRGIRSRDKLALATAGAGISGPSSPVSCGPPNSGGNNLGRIQIRRSVPQMRQTFAITVAGWTIFARFGIAVGLI